MGLAECLPLNNTKMEVITGKKGTKNAVTFTILCSFSPGRRYENLSVKRAPPARH